MKFWDDTTPITNARIAEAFRYSISEVRIMEMRFLKGLDYSFSLLAEDVKMFIFEAAKVELKSLHHHQTVACTPTMMAPLPVGVTARV